MDPARGTRSETGEARPGSTMNPSAAGQSMGETADEMRRDLGDVANTVAERDERLADEQLRAGASTADAAARAARRAAEELDRSAPELAGFAREAADAVESFGRSVRTRDVRGLLTDADDFARREPLAFFGLSVAAGFAVARFLSSSTAGGEAGPRDMRRGMGAGMGSASLRRGEAGAGMRQGRPGSGSTYQSGGARVMPDLDDMGRAGTGSPFGEGATEYERHLASEAAGGARTDARPGQTGSPRGTGTLPGTGGSGASGGTNTGGGGYAVGAGSASTGGKGMGGSELGTSPSRPGEGPAGERDKTRADAPNLTTPPAGQRS